MVKVGNVVVVMVEEVLDEIEGYETLLDKLGNLKSPHYTIQNKNDPSTLGYRCLGRGFPLLDCSGQQH